MSALALVPPYTHPATVLAALKQQGFALLTASDVAILAQCSQEEFAAFATSWQRLARDAYLKDGGKYRTRRHATILRHLVSRR